MKKDLAYNNYHVIQYDRRDVNKYMVLYKVKSLQEAEQVLQYNIKYFRRKNLAIRPVTNYRHV
jgi:hypothetical protein